ncbi:T9SS type A sorting domain-containing protein [Paucihalobacter ruber]|uniref:T9SS type A sorting domain-containing protein n=2 Tax=Paucihalobacter ruber TaxID=2567861 RepID=A0A506PIJ1_9FLAO|nr:T9SS type A sorting domain-containing protein [Paucihalobacter ruber]
MKYSSQHIKTMLLIVLLFGFAQEFQAQENSSYRIMRSNIGSSGSSQSIVTSKGTYNVSQSIGQGSVIGTHSNNGYYLRQGYQQPSSKIKIVKELSYELKANVYPNPFSQIITIRFSETMGSPISVMIFDVKAKLIYNQKFSPRQHIQLNLNDISHGIYLMKVNSKTKFFNTKLIKI